MAELAPDRSVYTCRIRLVVSETEETCMTRAVKLAAPTGAEVALVAADAELLLEEAGYPGHLRHLVASRGPGGVYLDFQLIDARHESGLPPRLL